MSILHNDLSRPHDTIMIASTGRALKPEQRPLGLIGEVVAPRWVFKKGAQARNFEMSWEMLLANGLPLHHETNAHFFETARRYFTACRNGDVTGKKLSLNVCRNKTYTIIIVMNFAISNGLNSIGELQKAHEQGLLHVLTRHEGTTLKSEGEKLTYQHIKFRLMTLYELSRLYNKTYQRSSVLTDGLSFTVFSSIEEASEFAGLVGKSGGITPDAPPECVFSLLGNSISYIRDFAEDLIYVEEQNWTRKCAPLARRTIDLAKMLMSALDDRPHWLDDNGKVVLKKLADAAGLSGRHLFRKNHRRLIALYEAIKKHPLSPGAKVARLEIRLESEQVPSISRRGALHHATENRATFPYIGKPGRNAPWPIEFLGSDTKGKRGLQTAINNLWTSCYIVVAAFMCDRLSETLGIPVDCITHGVDGAYIRTPKFKNRNSEGGSFLLQPCPPIVVQAVEILTRLGRTARDEAASDKLFCVRTHMGNVVPIAHTLIERLRRFAHLTGSDVQAGTAEKWSYAPHQLRRFFATAWVHYFEFGG